MAGLLKVAPLGVAQAKPPRVHHDCCYYEGFRRLRLMQPCGLPAAAADAAVRPRLCPSSAAYPSKFPFPYTEEGVEELGPKTRIAAEFSAEGLVVQGH